MRRSQYAVALALFQIALVSAPARAGDPHLDWKTIETEHFVVHYYEPLGDVGHRVAVVAERAHRVLSPRFGHDPEEKTHIVIVDDTDGANGFANVLPRNSIRLFATAPTATSSLNDHDDWLYGLTAHEYTHILHLDSIAGLPKLINSIVGKQWAPNQVQPRWVIEGIATYHESKQSSSGRVRSSLFDMQLRTTTLAGEELRLDHVTNGPRQWPRGNVAYMHGSHFLDYVFDRYGEDKLREMSWAYGSNPIPYGINRSIENATGETFVDLFQDWKNHRRDKYALQAEAIDRRGHRAGRRLTFSAETNVAPKYTRSGEELLWLQSDGLSDSRFRAIPRGATVGEARDWAELDRTGGYDVLSDGSLVVEQSHFYRTNYGFQELIRWDKATRRTVKLTDGARARDPSVSPDERRVAFVKNGHSRSELAVMDLRPEAEIEIAWGGPGRFDQVSRPDWSPDGTRIAFSAWRTGGYRDILVVDVTSGEVTELMHDRKSDISPVWDPSGKYIYYASDRDGIYNIYAHELETGVVRQVTNVYSGALEPDVSPDGRRLAYHAFGVGGWDIYEIELDESQWIEPVHYVNDRPDSTVVRNDEVEVSEVRDYRPIETIAPQQYEIQLVNNSFGTAVNVVTSGGDIVGHHRWSLGATYGIDRGNISFGGSYSYNRLWPSFRVAAARNGNRRGGIIVAGEDTRFTEENYALTFSMGMPVLRTPNGSATLNLDYDLDWLRARDADLPPHPDPNDPLPRFPETDVFVAGLSMRIGYGDVEGFVHTLGPQKGRFLAGSVRFNHPRLGSDFQSVDLGYTYEQYVRMPFGVTPVMMFRLTGGIRASNRRRSGGFTLGGVREQDIVNSIINSLRAGRSGYLRGYEQRSLFGHQYHLLNVEYRQELWNIERGFSTLPFYIRKLHVAALFDAGNAFDGEIDLTDFKTSIGGSLRLDMVFGYFVPGSLDIGYARGLNEDGIHEWWVLLTGNL